MIMAGYYRSTFLFIQYKAVVFNRVYFSICRRYGNCPKILYTIVANKMAYANSEDLDQKQSDQGLHYLPFH